MRNSGIFFLSLLLGCPTETHPQASMTPPEPVADCQGHADCGVNQACVETVCTDLDPVQPDAGGPAPVDSYVAGLEKSGDLGKVSVRLIESDPIPQDLTLYTWTLELRDAQGEAIDGASLIAEPTMPDHNHGTFPRFTEAVPLETAGHYELKEMDLFMAGVWQVDIEITLPSEGDAAVETDSVTFRFDLEG